MCNFSKDRNFWSSPSRISAVAFSVVALASAFLVWCKVETSEIMTIAYKLPVVTVVVVGGSE